MTNMTALLMKQMIQDAEQQGATLAFDTSTVEDQGERRSKSSVLIQPPLGVVDAGRKRKASNELKPKEDCERRCETTGDHSLHLMLL